MTCTIFQNHIQVKQENHKLIQLYLLIDHYASLCWNQCVDKLAESTLNLIVLKNIWHNFSTKLLLKKQNAKFLSETHSDIQEGTDSSVLCHKLFMTKYCHLNISSEDRFTNTPMMTQLTKTIHKWTKTSICK